MPVRDPQLFSLGGVAFGAWPQVAVRSFKAGAVTIETQDANRAGGQGVIPGPDRRRGAVWTWDLSTPSTTSEAAARALLAPLAAAWAATDTLGATELQTLRYNVAGRWRRVYGRARRWEPPQSGPALAAGRADVTADFEVLDPLHYDDAEQSLTLTSVPPTVGGLVAPIVAPIRTAKNSEDAHGQIVVGGDAPTPLRVVFRGPISNPWVTVGGVRIALSGNVASNTTVTVDARTRTVLRGSGGSAAGMLSRTARMSQLVLPPGTHSVRYGGNGTAQATIAWRNAWRSI